MKLTFFGSAGEVTGSAHLISAGAARVLRDCGTFQGRRAEAEAKNRSLAARVGRIDSAVIGHAHLDHCGNLPTLVKQGFRGPVFATPATADLLPVMWADSAHIQSLDLRFLDKIGQAAPAPEPLYTQVEVDAATQQIARAAYRQPVLAAPGISVEFLEAGHIFGAALNRVTVHEGDRVRRLGFALDLGRSGIPILRDPEPLTGIDTLVIECTYGARVHESFDDLEKRLAAVLKATVKRGGKVLIPAFALGRAQEVLYVIKQLFDTGQAPRIPVFLDSPLAVRVARIFRAHAELYDEEARRMGHAFLDKAFVKFLAGKDESQALNRLAGPCVILAASGMCESGRILHHLRHHLGDRRNTVLIVGFMAAHTVGRKLLNGERRVNLFGQPHTVNAEVTKLNAFSAHADRNDLLACIRQAGRLERIFFVHGEPTQLQAMADAARPCTEAELIIPAIDSEYEF